MSAFTIFLLTSAVLCVMLAVYGCSQRRDAFTRSFFGLMLASAVYALGYGLELASGSLEQMKLMLRLQYLGIPFLSLFWLGMAWAYLHPTGLPRRNMLLLSIPCLLVLFAFQTNDLHHLFYTDLAFARIDGVSIAQSPKGPLYWAHIAYLNLCIAVGILLFFRAWRQTMRVYRSQAICVLLGSFFPWIFHLIYLCGLSPHGMDLGPFGLAASGVLFAIASFQHGIFDVLPVARDLVFDGISEGVIVIDRQGRIADFNRAASRHVQGLDQAFIGKPLTELCAGRAIVAAIGSGEVPGGAEGLLQCEVELAIDGATRVFEVRVSAMRDRAGLELCRALVLLDVTEKKGLLQQLAQQAQTDPLTGLLNRGQWQREAERLIHVAQRSAVPLSVAIIDVDHFKDINDSQGHQAGDKALIAISTLFRAGLRASDLVGRMGGDEFMILLMGSSAADAALRLEALKAQSLSKLGITLSIGVSELSPQCAGLEALLVRADQCLYRAKAEGRNRVSSVS